MKKCIDHLGKEYKSITEMCRNYNIPVTTFKNRLNIKRYTLEKALTDPVKKYKKRKSKNDFLIDHLGNRYISTKSMCDTYNIKPSTFMQRIKNGWNLEEALMKSTVSKQNGAICYDHNGNQYNSIKDMCIEYKIDYHLFYNRYKSGWSVEKALTEPIKRCGEYV